MKITQETVKKLFVHKKGKLYWKVDKSKTVKSGDLAGYLDRGYIRIMINYRFYLRSRLIWLWHYGYLPENRLDHINRIRDDDRIKNLREISHQCNLRNTGNPKDNTSGVKGIYWYKQTKRWVVQIISKSVGYYKDFDEAVLARLAAEQCLDWSNCDSDSPAYRYAINNNLITSN